MWMQAQALELAVLLASQPSITDTPSWLAENGPWGLLVISGMVIGVLARAYAKERDSKDKTILTITNKQVDLLDRVVVAIEASKNASDDVAKAMERHTQELSELTKELVRRGSTNQ